MKDSFIQQILAQYVLCPRHQVRLIILDFEDFRFQKRGRVKNTMVASTFLTTEPNFLYTLVET